MVQKDMIGVRLDEENESLYESENKWFEDYTNRKEQLDIIKNDIIRYRGKDMEKIEEHFDGIYYQKTYTDDNVTLLNIMDEFEQNNDINGWYIRVSEGLEDDDLNFNQDVTFDRIRNDIVLFEVLHEGATYSIAGEYQGNYTWIDVDSLNNRLILNTIDPGLEITEFIKKMDNQTC